MRRGRDARQTRRQAAEGRQSAREARTDTQQLKVLDELGCAAVKERARLAVRIAKAAK